MIWETCLIISNRYRKWRLVFPSCRPGDHLQGPEYPAWRYSDPPDLRRGCPRPSHGTPRGTGRRSTAARGSARRTRRSGRPRCRLRTPRRFTARVSSMSSKMITAPLPPSSSVVSAKLCAAAVPSRATDLRPAGEHDLGDAPMLRERGPGLVALSVDQVDHPVGHAGGLEQPHQPQRGERRLLRRLDDHRVPGREAKARGSSTGSSVGG